MVRVPGQRRCRRGRTPAGRQHRHHQQGAAARRRHRPPARAENGGDRGDRHRQCRPGRLPRARHPGRQHPQLLAGVGTRTCVCPDPGLAAPAARLQRRCGSGPVAAVQPLLPVRPSDRRPGRQPAWHRRIRRPGPARGPDRPGLRHAGLRGHAHRAGGRRHQRHGARPAAAQLRRGQPAPAAHRAHAQSDRRARTGEHEAPPPPCPASTPYRDVRPIISPSP